MKTRDDKYTPLDRRGEGDSFLGFMREDRIEDKLRTKEMVGFIGYLAILAVGGACFLYSLKASDQSQDSILSERQTVLEHDVKRDR
ncbi:MAG: hypothetical protein KJ718_03885 [Nanoarchaeota archaeon]|nr:hypothetical protein [Nanoarchaeota archaeon]MBU1051669.1 hypothetical protein [Nanoarchaeota archaeon]